MGKVCRKIYKERPSKKFGWEFKDKAVSRPDACRKSDNKDQIVRVGKLNSEFPYEIWTRKTKIW